MSSDFNLCKPSKSALSVIPFHGEEEMPIKIDCITKQNYFLTWHHGTDKLLKDVKSYLQFRVLQALFFS
jgi:hypothetical protein